jgi:hypothetical protein
MIPSFPLSNPYVGVALRGMFGAYVIYMARKFYRDPLGYFRKSSRAMPDVPWLPAVVRGMACFCLWGGCFIVATAIAVQVFGFHGDLLAIVLVTIAAVAAWLLLPSRPPAESDQGSPGQNQRDLP